MYDKEMNSEAKKVDKTGNKTAKELLENATNLRNQRLRNNEIRQQIKDERQKEQQIVSNKYHSMLRHKKHQDLVSYVQKQTDKDVSNRLGQYKTLK